MVGKDPPPRFWITHCPPCFSSCRPCRSNCVTQRGTHPSLTTSWSDCYPTVFSFQESCRTLWTFGSERRTPSPPVRPTPWSHSLTHSHASCGVVMLMRVSVFQCTKITTRIFTASSLERNTLFWCRPQTALSSPMVTMATTKSSLQQ